ncbi:glutathione S-transferase [Pseudooceanicola sediminis]|uniref:glutathione transferase n=1 Tax=Pseudooceanicola sediminis TaxID=2211117 RepID=A0A399J551_9RHOB|nr:glutathione S-transferase [Puniceibacterium sp. HSS470]RII40451.1 glutathione S-transferase [Pseudooceanicola sediminis]
MSITVHHLNNSRSQRVLWLLEELELPYTITRYQRDPKTMLAPAALKKVHPLGKSPVVVDEEANLTVAETAVIVEYLIDLAGGRMGPPDDPAEALRYRYWMHYAEGSLMPPLLLKLAMRRVPIMGRLAVRKVQPMIEVHLDFVEATLSRQEWFSGEQIGGADVMMSFPLEAACSRAGLDGSRPATMEWLDRIHARPAYKAALAQGGPYAYA